MKKNGILHRISTAVLAGAMLLSLASCGASSSQTASSAAGKVTGTGSAKGIEGDVVVEVTADADTIYSIVVTEQNETQGIGSVACEQLPDAMVAANSYNVDGIAGATVTSDALKEAVKAALENAGLDASAFAVAKAADTTVEKTAETLDCDVVVVGAGGAGLTAAAQAAGTLWVLEREGQVVASVILNHHQDDFYADIDWQYPALPEQVLVVHTLCIPPSLAGQGLGRECVSRIKQHAAAIGCAAIRLDTWAGNTPAAALYQKNGFVLRGSARVLFQGKIPEELICLEAPCRPADGSIAADEK